MVMFTKSLVCLTLVFVSGLTACTITTTDSAEGSGDPSSAPGTPPESGESPESPAAPSGDPSTSSGVPAELAGTSWTWTTSAGARRLAFAADGSYESDVFVNGHPGDSCGTEYFTHHAGKVTFEADKLTLRSSVAERTKSDSCQEEVLSKETIDPFVTTYQWRLGDDGTGREALILTDETMPDAPSHYYPDGE
jgi:hypothetical protein